MKIIETHFHRKQYPIATAYVVRYACELVVDSPRGPLTVRNETERSTPAQAYNDAIYAAFSRLEEEA